MIRRRYKMPSSGSVKTYAVIDGVDYNDVVAEYDSSEPESDVNWPGNFEVTGVTVCGVEMIGYMSQDEIDSIAERLESKLSADGEDDPRY